MHSKKQSKNNIDNETASSMLYKIFYMSAINRFYNKFKDTIYEKKITFIVNFSRTFSLLFF